VDESKPLPSSLSLSSSLSSLRSSLSTSPLPAARGLHSSSFRLKLSAFCGIGGALRGCLGGAWKVLGNIWGYLGCTMCQRRLMLSSNVNECKPVPAAPREGPVGRMMTSCFTFSCSRCTGAYTRSLQSLT